MKPLSLIVQLQGATPPFHDTRNKTLGGIPLDLIIGFSGNAFTGKPTHFFWQVAFSEDLLGKGPSVDFSSYLRIGREF